VSEVLLQFVVHHAAKPFCNCVLGYFNPLKGQDDLIFLLLIQKESTSIIIESGSHCPFA